MPVLVVAAATPFGHALCEALRGTGGQVRAYVHRLEDAQTLRALGVHVAIGGPVDVERLEAACAQVHTVVHLTGRRSGRAARDETEALEVTAIAADAADVPRLIVPRPSERDRRKPFEAGLAYLANRSFEAVVLPEAAGDPEAIEAILAADARS